jgi:hypothetical protein
MLEKHLRASAIRMDKDVVLHQPYQLKLMLYYGAGKKNACFFGVFVATLASESSASLVPYARQQLFREVECQGLSSSEIEYNPAQIISSGMGFLFTDTNENSIMMGRHLLGVCHRIDFMVRDADHFAGFEPILGD